MDIGVIIVNKDPKILARDIIKQILIDAGRWYGLCDYRPEFGLFEVEKFELLEKELNEQR